MRRHRCCRAPAVQHNNSRCCGHHCDGAAHAGAPIEDYVGVLTRGQLWGVGHLCYGGEDAGARANAWAMATIRTTMTTPLTPVAWTSRTVTTNASPMLRPWHSATPVRPRRFGGSVPRYHTEGAHERRGRVAGELPALAHTDAGRRRPTLTNATCISRAHGSRQPPPAPCGVAAVWQGLASPPSRQRRCGRRPWAAQARRRATTTRVAIASPTTGTCMPRRSAHARRIPWPTSSLGGRQYRPGAPICQWWWWWEGGGAASPISEGS